MSTIIAERRVKARKDHKCFGCLGPIPKGTEHQADAVVDCGVIFTARLCAECVEKQRYIDPWDEYAEGELRDITLEELR